MRVLKEEEEEEEQCSRPDLSCGLSAPPGARCGVP